MGTEREFDALASEAIASSEKEFFADAMDAKDDLTDGTEDRSLEEMGSGLEGQHESDDEQGEEEEGDGADPEAKAEGDEATKAADRDNQGRFAPKGQEPAANRSETPAERGLRNELTGERDKRKAVETDFTNYRAENDRRFAALEARLAQTPPQQQQPQPKVEPAKDEAPDRWTDPVGYDRWFKNQILNEARAERVSGSFEDAKSKHGSAYDEAFNAANGLPADDAATKQLVQAIMRSPNPGEHLIQWHRRQQAAKEIGDPIAYRERVMADAREALMKDPEFRKQVLGGVQGEARAGDGSPRTLTKLPPSLSSTRGGSVNRAGSVGTSDQELFDDVMS